MRYRQGKIGKRRYIFRTTSDTETIVQLTQNPRDLKLLILK